MSAESVLLVRCDVPDPSESDGRCNTEHHWPVAFEPHTHRELRRLLKERRGWRRTRDGRDICPDCAEAGRR